MGTMALVSFLFHKLGQPRYDGDVYSLPPQWLRRLVALATEQSCGFVHFNHVLAGLPNDHKVFVALTFDDGFESDVTEALPIMQEHSIPATFFITPGLIGQAGYLQWSQVRTLAAAGMAIGSHTLTHPCLPRLSSQDLHKELLVSRQLLEDQLGAPVKLLSVPGGFYNRYVLEAAWEAGYTLVSTSDCGIDRLSAEKQSQPVVLKRNGVDLRTSWDVIGTMLQARIPAYLLVKEQTKRSLARLMPALYQRMAGVWRRKIVVYRR